MWPGLRGVGGEDMHVGLHPWGSGDTASCPRHSRPGRGCSKVRPRDALSSRWTMIIPKEPLRGGRGEGGFVNRRITETCLTVITISYKEAKHRQNNVDMCKFPCNCCSKESLNSNVFCIVLSTKISWYEAVTAGAGDDTFDTAWSECVTGFGVEPHCEVIVAGS